jgi:hypothetical protein
MEDGLAENVSVGCRALTVMVTLWVLVPPAPVQAIVNEVVAENAETDSEPAVAFAPDQPPLAEQAVALVLLHDSVTDPPGARDIESAARDTVGEGVGTLVADPLSPPPPQDPSRTSGRTAKVLRIVFTCRPRDRRANKFRSRNVWMYMTRGPVLELLLIPRRFTCMSRRLRRDGNSSQMGVKLMRGNNVMVRCVRWFTSVGVLALFIGCADSKKSAQQVADVAAQTAANVESTRLKKESREQAETAVAAVAAAAASAEAERAAGKGTRRELDAR